MPFTEHCPSTNSSHSFFLKNINNSVCLFRLFHPTLSLFTRRYSFYNIKSSNISVKNQIFKINMLFRATILAFAGLASACVQQPTGALGGNPIGQPTLNQIVPVGKPFTITWNVSISEHNYILNHNSLPN